MQIVAVVVFEVADCHHCSFEFADCHSRSFEVTEFSILFKDDEYNLLFACLFNIDMSNLPCLCSTDKEMCTLGSLTMC